MAATREEALALDRELNPLVAPALGVEYLSSRVGMVLSGDVDDPLPDVPVGPRVSGVVRGVWEVARSEGLTIRQTYLRLLAVEESPPFDGGAIGTAREVADEMEHWFRSGACVGFRLVVPTLREELGLAVPENPRFSRQTG